MSENNENNQQPQKNWLHVVGNIIIFVIAGVITKLTGIVGFLIFLAVMLTITFIFSKSE